MINLNVRKRQKTERKTVETNKAKNYDATQRLKSWQKAAYLQVINDLSQNKLFILEAGTGWGKTVFAGAVAEKFQDKRVIICTENNQLVDDFHKTLTMYDSVKFSFNEGVQEIIGKNNYINPEKEGLVADFFKNPDLLKSYLIKAKENAGIDKATDEKIYNSHDFLFSSIFKEVELIDKGSQHLVKKLAGQAKRLEYAGDLKGTGVKITNNAYFILSAAFGGENFSDSVVIIDEADTFVKSAISIFSDTFSLFGFKNLIKKLINMLKEKEKRGAKTALKSLSNLHKACVKTLEKSANQDLISERPLSHHDSIFASTKSKLSDLYDEVISNKGVGFLKSKYADDEIVKALFDEIDNIKMIVEHKAYAVYLNFSPVMGYSFFSILKKPIGAELTNLWKRTSALLLMSATCSAGKDKNYLASNLQLKNAPLPYVAKSPFDKQKCRIYIPEKSAPSVKSELKEGIEFLPAEWLEYFCPFISSTTENKNAMIITGSYKDTENLYKTLAMYTSQNIVRADRLKSKISQLEEFKVQGGIFIAPRHFGRGVDLPGKFLEKIYICRLPYNPPGDVAYIQVSQGEKGNKMRKDMLNSLEQMIGRGIRMVDDECDVYILDTRMYDCKVYENIIVALNKKGVVCPIEKN